MKIAVLYRGEPKNSNMARDSWLAPWIHNNNDVKFFGSLPNYEGNVWDLKLRVDFDAVKDRRLTKYVINDIKEVVKIINYFSEVIYKRDINELSSYKEKYGYKELFQLIRMLNQVIGSLLCRNLLADYVQENKWYPDFVIDTRYDLDIHPTESKGIHDCLDDLYIYDELKKCKGKTVLLNETVIDKVISYVPFMTYNYSKKNTVWFPDWFFVQEYNHDLFKQDAYLTVKNLINTSADEFYSICSNGNRSHYAWHFFNPHHTFIQNNFSFEYYLQRPEYWEKHLEINPINAYTLPEDEELNYVWDLLSK